MFGARIFTITRDIELLAEFGDPCDRELQTSNS